MALARARELSGVFQSGKPVDCREAFGVRRQSEASTPLSALPKGFVAIIADEGVRAPFAIFGVQLACSRFRVSAEAQKKRPQAGAVQTLRDSRLSYCISASRVASVSHSGVSFAIRS
jgi:hypothetical protein